MYGFGGSTDEDDEVIGLIMRKVDDFLSVVINDSYKRSLMRGYNELKLKDVMDCIRSDKKMYYRAIKMTAFRNQVSSIRKDALMTPKVDNIMD